MKKFTLILFALLTLLPMSIWADEYTENNVKYTYTPVTVGTGFATVSECPDEATITIPDVVTINGKNYTVTAIAANAFNNCPNMATLNILCSNLPSMEDGTFNNVIKKGLNITFKGIKYTHRGTWNNGDSFQVTGVSDNTYDSFEILDAINNINVTEIGDNAFANLPNKTVFISKNINTISSIAFINYTTGDINNANRLTSITVDPDNNKFFDYNGVLYSRYDQEVELVTCPIKNDYSDIWHDKITAIGDNAFICHKNLSSITIPATVKTIGQSAFNFAGANQTSLTISFEANSNLSTIGISAFRNSAVVTLSLPEGLKEIKNFAFQDCIKLTTITFPTSLEKLGNSAFMGCNYLENITFLGTSLKIISEKAFYNCLLSTPFTIPNGVTTIQGNAFNDGNGNSNLCYPTSVVRIPSTVTYIAETAFPDGVTKQYQLNLAFGDNEEWATYYSLDDLELPTGIEAWAITGFDPLDNTKLDTIRLHYIHKEEAILLHWTEGADRSNFWCPAPSAQVKTDDQGKSSNGDIFIGSTDGINDFSSIPGDKYVLSGDEFVKANQGSLPAFRCYIVRPNANDPTDHLYFKNDGVNSDHTFIYKVDGNFLNNKKYDDTIGKATLSPATGGKMKLTITPGANYYAYYDDNYYNDSTKSDITVRRNVTAVSGRAAAIGLDNTFYHLDPGEDSSQDKCGAIVYTFDPGKITVFEVTVNFHSRTDFQAANTKPKVNLQQPDIIYSYDGTAHKPDVKSVTYGDNETIVDPNNYDIVYTDSINAGQGKVIIKGKRKFMREFHGEYTIERRNIENIHANVIADQIYTGYEIKPELGISDGDITITEGTDYTLKWENNTDVNTSGDEGKNAKVSIIAKEGNYTGTKVKYFKILPKDLSTEENKATITIPKQDYTGSAIEPTNEIEVKDGSKILELGTDYNVEYPYDDNIEAGVNSATAKIIFKGNYTGTLEEKFTIEDPGLERTVTVSFDSSNEWTTYYPAENLNLDNVKTELEAWVVTGINGLEVSTEYVDFIPKNTPVLLHRKSGDKTSFDVKTCSGRQLEGVTPSAIFQGTATDLDISTVTGTKFVLLNGKFVRTVEGTLKANRCYLIVNDIDFPVLTIGKTDDIIYQEEGKVAKTSIGTAFKSEKDGVVTLTVKPNKGYYVEASDITVVRNANAGKGRAQQIDNGAVTVTPGTITDDVDNNTSTYLFTYNVEKDCQYQVTVNFHKATNLQGGVGQIAQIDALEYNKSALEPAPIVKVGETTLVKNVDYMVRYENNMEPGNAKVYVNGIRKYANEINQEFKINQRSISHATLKGIENLTDPLIYTGQDIVIQVEDLVGETNIIDDSEYTLTCVNLNKKEDKKNAGKHTATITGKNHYTGTKTVEFEIQQKEMKDEDVENIPNQDYTGRAIEPKLTIKYGENTFVVGTDYDVEWKNNVEAGEATATITFNGNYKGTVVKKFTIEDPGLERTVTVSFDSSNEWTTYYPAENLNLDNVKTELEAWVVTGRDGTTVNTTKVEFIPKGVPVLLHRISGEKTSFDVITCSGRKLEGVTPSAIFQGTATDLDISTISGTKFVLFNGQFVQTATGTLPAGRCYLLVNEDLPGVTTLTIGKGISEIITMEDGQETTAVGSAIVRKNTPNEKNNTLIVSPKSGFYADREDITVVVSVEAGSARAPEVGAGKVELTPVEGYNDTSKEFRYTFPNTDGYFYQVTINFHKCINFQNKETQPVITLEEGTYTYDGTEKKPKIASVTMFDGTVTLTEGKDFTVTYENNILAGGNAKANITGMNHYASIISKNFSIAQRDIKLATIVAIPDQIYNGTEIKPEVIVKDIVQIDGSDVDLMNKVEDKPDYSLEFINNINAGTAQVNVLSNNINYRGVKTGTTFTILPKDLSLAGNEPTIEPIEIQIYTGEPLKPALVIRDGDLLVTPDNYDVEYDNNIVEGTANATVTFKKNYKGTAKTTFEIVYLKESKKLNVDFGNQDEWTTYYSPIDLENVEGLNIFVVTGLNKGQDIDLKTEQINYIPKNIGVLLQRTDKTKTAFFGETMSSNTKLEGVTPDTDLFRGTATGIDDLKTIDGIKYILQNDRFIQVTEGALPANRCYVFINNENDEGINHVEGDDPDGIVIQEEGESSKTAGTVTLSEVSSDGYKTITVEPASVVYATQDEVKVVRSIKNDTPAASSNRVPGIENSLVEVIAVNPSADPSGTTQYKFKYDNAYHYQITVDFQKRINLSDPAISHPVVTLKAEDIQSLEYDGKEKRPRVEKVACNNIEVDPSNYTISYENNVNAGMPRVVITGKRFLMGSTHAEFSISKRNFSHVTVEEPIADKEYTSLPITPTLVIKDIVDGKNIVNANDYELILENNVKVGTAKVTLKPKNNYYGSYKDFYFNIIPAKYLKGDVNGDGLVNVTDIVATVNYIMEKPSNKFNKEAADVNGDGEVNVTDIVMMVSIIMSDNGGSSRRAAATSNKLVVNGNNIQLKNAETYTAAQFDINLGDGQSISNVVLNDISDHSLYWKMIDANTCRVVVYSMTNAAFRANSDNLITIFMTGGRGTTINNELLIKADGATGIEAIRTEAENGKVYDLNGRQVKNPEKGIYIINGKKVMVK